MRRKETESHTREQTLQIVVMGGLGFIGSHLSRALLQNGCRVRIFDKLYASRDLIHDIEQNVEIIEGDVERVEDVLQCLKGADIAINLIHTTVPGSSMQDPVHDVESNVVSCARWLSRLNETRLKRLIYISSGGTIYGVPLYNPITEDHPTEPMCSYGITKLAIEKYTAMYAKLHGVEYRICRPSNVYGEGQRLHIGQGVIGVFLDRALQGKPIEIWGDGTNKRDYMYIRDLVNGLIELINHQGEGRVFNMSTGIGYSLNDIISIMNKYFSLPIKVQYVRSRGFDVKDNILDSGLYRSETSWEPGVSIHEGIHRVYEWLNGSTEDCT